MCTHVCIHVSFGTAQKNARDRVNRAPMATLQEISRARSGERGLMAGAVLHKAAHEGLSLC